MTEYQTIKMYKRGVEKIFSGEITENDFKNLIEECSKNPFDIISQKIKEMGESVLNELKLRKRRKEQEQKLQYNYFNEDDIEVD